MRIQPPLTSEVLSHRHMYPRILFFKGMTVIPLRGEEASYMLGMRNLTHEVPASV